MEGADGEVTPPLPDGHGSVGEAGHGSDGKAGHGSDGAPRRLAINFLFLSGGEITAKLLTFVCFSYLARMLGPASYGAVEFTLAVMVFFTLPVDLGLSWYGTREIAHNPSCAARLLHEITGLRLVLAVCSMAALAVPVAIASSQPCGNS
jgi:O-antigen/teichoic acid export membrane protein